MTMFTTTIERMYTMPTPEPNYVVNLHWKVVGVDGQYTAQIDGSTQFNSADQENAFIPYDQLTPEIVTGWIPQNQIDSAQACVQGQINSMINPPVSPQVAALPWAA